MRSPRRCRWCSASEASRVGRTMPRCWRRASRSGPGAPGFSCGWSESRTQRQEGPRSSGSIGFAPPAGRCATTAPRATWRWRRPTASAHSPSTPRSPRDLACPSPKASRAGSPAYAGRRAPSARSRAAAAASAWQRRPPRKSPPPSGHCWNPRTGWPRFRPPPAAAASGPGPNIPPSFSAGWGRSSGSAARRSRALPSGPAGVKAPPICICKVRPRT